nr:hypothetical protein [Tanacetum cinerariifolium]
MTSLTRLGATLAIPSIFIGGWDMEANQRSRSFAWRTNKIGGLRLKMGGASKRLEGSVYSYIKSSSLTV